MVVVTKLLLVKPLSDELPVAVVAKPHLKEAAKLLVRTLMPTRWPWCSRDAR
ncbi:hypothetical protein PC119_g17943 [Phytophthora cactorum]|nr:hypothetical protein PC119_g17943 [Phytophthora cactorum]